MSTFRRYSSYYDLLYQNKDYRAEARFVSDQLDCYASGNKRILDLGCGTGRHASELALLGHKVHGIDLSESMLQEANQRRMALTEPIQTQVSFEQGDIQRYRSSRAFDAVISIFHVVSYQTDNHALRAAFLTASAHLRNDGLFAFDFWYGPAVLTQRPAVRVLRLENDRTRIIRIAEPSLMEHANLVKVDYTLLAEDKASHHKEEIVESHTMRYLFLPEVDLLLEGTGFRRLIAVEWLTQNQPSSSSWSVFVIARKVEHNAS